MEGGVLRVPSVADGEAGPGLRSKGTGSRDEKMRLGKDLLLGEESRLDIHMETLSLKNLTEMTAKELFFLRHKPIRIRRIGGRRQKQHNFGSWEADRSGKCH